MCLASKQLPPRSTGHTVHRARDLESTVAQGFVKHSFKVLLHRVVDGPLQALRCLVSRTLCVYTRYTRVFWALTSEQHARVSQGRLCLDNSTCCHTEIVADQTVCLTNSNDTDTQPTSPSVDPITPGVRQSSHRNTKF